MDRNDAREAMITVQRPVMEIVHAPDTSDAKTDRSGQDIPTGRTKIYFKEYYFLKWGFRDRKNQHIFTPEIEHHAYMVGALILYVKILRNFGYFLHHLKEGLLD
jgi:hypothetical protein